MYRWVEPRMPEAPPTDSKEELIKALTEALETEVGKRLESLEAALDRVPQGRSRSNELKEVMYKTPAQGVQSLLELAAKERLRLWVAKQRGGTPKPAPWEKGLSERTVREYRPAIAKRRTRSDEGASGVAAATSPPPTASASRKLPRAAAPARRE